jgi:hypothetical protein
MLKDLFGKIRKEGRVERGKLMSGGEQGIMNKDNEQGIMNKEQGISK